MDTEGPCFHCQTGHTQLWRRGPPEKPVLCIACGSWWEKNGTLEDYTPEHGMKDAKSGPVPKSVLPSNTTSSASAHAVENPELSGSNVVGHAQPSVVSPEEIELVQNLTERCLQLYMSRDEVVKTLSTRARIHPEFTTVVWQKLEEQNAAFFRAYYISLELKKQITLFNHLLEHQSHLMKDPSPPEVPLAPISSRIHPMAVDNLPMGNPVLQQPPVPVAAQPHLESMDCGISSPRGVNGAPLPGNFRTMQMNSGNDMVIDGQAAEVVPAIAASSGMPSMSEMPLSPIAAASIGHFYFSASDMSGMGISTPALSTAFTSDALPPDSGAGHSGDSIGSLDQFPLNLSPLDLPADFSNLGDLGPLPNYPGFPFLPPNSDSLDFPELEDTDTFFSVNDFFADLCPGPPGYLPDEDGS